MSQKLIFFPSRFLSLRDTHPQASSWEAIVDEIKGPLHRDVTLHYRETLSRIRALEGEGDTGNADNLKGYLRNVKMNQPAFVPSVSLEGGRSDRHITGYSGFIMGDIDGLEGDALYRAMHRLRQDKYVFLVHFTLSGCGIRVLVRVDAPVTKRNFLSVWKKVNAYYADLLGVPMDLQCKNATRMSVICHDPDVLFRPERLFPCPTVQRILPVTDGRR